MVTNILILAAGSGILAVVLLIFMRSLYRAENRALRNRNQRLVTRIAALETDLQHFRADEARRQEQRIAAARRAGEVARAAALSRKQERVERTTAAVTGKFRPREEVVAPVRAKRNKI